MIELKRKKKKIRSMDMIPLINVVFLLLIFFLVAGTVKKTDIVAVDLPEAKNFSSVEENDITVILSKTGEIAINESAIPLDKVAIEIYNKLQNNPEREISIKADANMPAKRLIEIMDIIKLSGGRNISLVTQGGA